MAFNYGISSHLIHKDAIALKIIQDRVFREENRRNAVELAHGCRMISDIFSFSTMRSTLFYKVQKEDAKRLRNLLEMQQPFLQELKDAIQAWHDIEYENPST